MPYRFNDPSPQFKKVTAVEQPIQTEEENTETGQLNDEQPVKDDKPQPASHQHGQQTGRAGEQQRFPQRFKLCPRTVADDHPARPGIQEEADEGVEDESPAHDDDAEVAGDPDDKNENAVFEQFQ